MRKRRSITLRVCLRTLVFLLLLSCLPRVAQPQSERRRVLILYEVGTSGPAVSLIYQGIVAAFETSPYKLEIYREYMESVLFPDPADQQMFREFYIRKYQHRRPDVIITAGPTPLKFMVEMHDRAFPGVPIVFCLPEFVRGTPPADSSFTGVLNEMDAAETVRVAALLQPGT